MELKDECLKVVALPAFEVVASVSKDMLPFLGEGGWAECVSLQRTAAVVRVVFRDSCKLLGRWRYEGAVGQSC